MKNIKLSVVLPCSPDVAFAAWLDSKKHGEIIGDKAEIDPTVGGSFSIWDGYFTGKTLEIDEAKHRIVQSWRDNSTDWPDDHFSELTVEFTQDKLDPNSSVLRLQQSGLPDNHADSIKQGWIDYYFEPMRKYFS